MIDIETRLLEILDWDESEMERIYEKVAAFLASNQLKDRESLLKSLSDHLRDDLDQEGLKLVFSIIDQNIRKEARIIEE